MYYEKAKEKALKLQEEHKKQLAAKEESKREADREAFEKYEKLSRAFEEFNNKVTDTGAIYVFSNMPGAKACKLLEYNRVVFEIQVTTTYNGQIYSTMIMYSGEFASKKYTTNLEEVLDQFVDDISKHLRV